MVYTLGINASRVSIVFFWPSVSKNELDYFHCDILPFFYCFSLCVT